MYKLNPTTLNFEKILGDIDGLVTLMSPTGDKIIYSESRSGSPNLYSFDTKTQQTSNLFFRTFTDKCTWSAKEADVVYCAVPQDIAYGDYPDAWYQGLIFFTDDIWKINTKTGETRLIAKLNQLGDSAIDVINPALSQNEDYFVFNNKKDLSLWGLKLPIKTIASSTKPAIDTKVSTSTKNNTTNNGATSTKKTSVSDKTF
jgi:Tol biopolymer transport system component